MLVFKELGGILLYVLNVIIYVIKIVRLLMIVKSVNVGLWIRELVIVEFVFLIVFGWIIKIFFILLNMK